MWLSIAYLCCDVTFCQRVNAHLPVSLTTHFRDAYCSELIVAAALANAHRDSHLLMADCLCHRIDSDKLGQCNSCADDYCGPDSNCRRSFVDRTRRR